MLNTITSNTAYEQLWMTVAGQTSTVVSVKACSGVTIVLASMLGNTREETFEFELLRSEDNMSAILDKVNGSELYRTHTPFILDCKEYRSVIPLIQTCHIHIHCCINTFVEAFQLHKLYNTLLGLSEMLSDL